MDSSLLSKILSSKRRCPDDFVERAEQWLATRSMPAQVHTCGSTSDDELNILDQALAYLARGWSVVPQVAGAKKPCVQWKPYQSRLPSEDELRDWFARWRHAGIVCVLGPVSDLFVIDVDGDEAHAALIQQLGSEPLAPRANSGSGMPNRYHLFFRHPPLATKAKITPWHPKLEFRGNRGLIVLPPSLHKSGNRYAWAPRRSLNDLELPELPAPVISALQTLTHRPTVTASLPQTIATGSVPGSRSTREFLSGRWADGPGWNQRLFQAACDLQGRGIPYGAAVPLLLAGARPYDAINAEFARNTIASAYSQSREPGHN
jgi:hypothetical protein